MERDIQVAPAVNEMNYEQYEFVAAPIFLSVTRSGLFFLMESMNRNEISSEQLASK